MGDQIKISATVTPSLADLARKYSFPQSTVTSIAVSAGNRALTSGRAGVVKDIAAAVNLKQADIRDGIQRVGFTRNRLEGRLEISRKPIPLIDFVRGSAGLRRATRGDGGVAVEVRKGAAQTLPGTFIAQLSNGKTAIFERGTRLPTSGPNAGKAKFVRGGEARKYRSVARFVINQRFGLTLVGYVGNAPEFLSRQTLKIQTVFADRVQSGVQRFLSQ